MTDIVFTQPHQLSHRQAMDAAQKVADRMAQELEMETVWEGDVMRFERSGLSGALNVNKTDAHIEISLGFLLKAFKPMIEEKVTRHMKIVFGGAA